jgi:hypothetical protein
MATLVIPAVCRSVETFPYVVCAIFDMLLILLCFLLNNFLIVAGWRWHLFNYCDRAIPHSACSAQKPALCHSWNRTNTIL